MNTVARFLAVIAVLIGIVEVCLFIFIGQELYIFIVGASIIAIGMWSLDRLSPP